MGNEIIGVRRISSHNKDICIEYNILLSCISYPKYDPLYIGYIIVPFCIGIAGWQGTNSKAFGVTGGVNVLTVFIKKHTVEPR